MINKDGGGDNFKILWGDTAVMIGDIELMGDPQSPTRENPVGGVQYIGGYHDTCGGYHEYIRGFSVHQGDTMSISGGYHEYIGGCSVHRSCQ